MISTTEASRELGWYSEIEVPPQTVRGVNWERIARMDV